MEFSDEFPAAALSSQELEELEKAACPEPGEGLPSWCRQCGLYRTASSWCVEAEIDPRVDDSPFRPVMVVGQGPGSEEDRLRRVWQGWSGMQVRAWTGRLEAPVILTNATRCYPGKNPETGRDNTPTEAQIQLCASHYLAPLIRHFRPAVIVCHGVPAMKAVLGKAAPRSLQAAGKQPLTLPGSDTLVLVTHHPASQSLEGEMVNELRRVYVLADRIAMGQYRDEEVPFQVLRNREQARAWARSLGVDWLVLDVEHRECEEDPDRLSFWHPGAELLCMSVAWYDGQSYHARVLTGEALDADVVRLLVRGRRVYTWNGIHDLLALHRFLGVDLLELARREEITLPTGQKDWRPGLDDGMVRKGLKDLNRIGNGLKPTICETFGVRDWSAEVWELVDRRRAEVRQENRRRELERRRRGPSPELEPLPMPDLGDIEEAVLLRYSAADAWWPARYWQEVQSREKDAADPLAVHYILRSIALLAEISKNGMPVDRERLLRVKGEREERIRQYRLWLLNQPEVQRAIEATPRWQKYARRRQFLRDRLQSLGAELEKLRFRLEKAGNSRPGLAEKLRDSEEWLRLYREELERLSCPEAILDMVQVNGVKLFEALLRETGCLDRVPRTATGLPSDSAPVLAELGEFDPSLDRNDPKHRERIAREDAARSRTGWIWWAWAHIKLESNVVGTFIQQYLPYTLADGRMHHNFSVIKSEPPGRATGADRARGGARSTRFVSSNPNLLNIIHDPDIRACIAAPDESWECVELDMDAGEPRCLAAVTRCRLWLDIFRRRLPFYEFLANRRLKLGIDTDRLPDEELRRLLDAKLGLGPVTPEIRAATKTRILAWQYGEHPRAAAAKSGISLEDALAFDAWARENMPEFPEWWSQLRATVARGEPVTNLIGMRTWWPYHGDPLEDDRVFRQYSNWPIQSLLAIITAWQLENCRRWIHEAGMADRVQIFHLVYDAGWFLVRRDWTRQIVPRLAAIMRDTSRLPFEFVCPLEVGCKRGPDMGHGLKKDPSLVRES